GDAIYRNSSTSILKYFDLRRADLVFFFVCLSTCLSSGVYCDLSVDGIGTCWPRSAAGELISRPCPEQFNGIHYNTTSTYHRGPHLSRCSFSARYF
uniref:G-protein coupled receptors family 2 profile 1 domain-containing protein n=1 Tax=Amphiprion percula TaxID=161767 RepID=A0A3P8SL23_AMPPE